MLSLRYLPGVATLELDADACIGCGRCEEVCPHAVFAIEERKARLLDRDACMECGACARNCPVEAVTVRAGVGCAAALLSSGVGKSSPSCSGPPDRGDTGCCG